MRIVGTRIPTPVGLMARADDESPSLDEACTTEYAREMTIVDPIPKNQMNKCQDIVDFSLPVAADVAHLAFF